MEQEETLHSKEWNAERLKAIRAEAQRIKDKHNKGPQRKWTHEEVQACIVKSTKGRIAKPKGKKKRSGKAWDGKKRSRKIEQK